MPNEFNYSGENTLLYIFQVMKNFFVKKESGKGLSTNDYTNAEKEKLNGLQASQNISADKENQTKYATPYAVHQYIGTKLGAALVYGGSIPFASLPALSAENVGHVYNITDAFTTTQNFIEGAGHSYGAGQNVAIAEPSEGIYRYDVLSQAINLTEYAKKEDLQEISNDRIDELWNSVFTEE